VVLLELLLSAARSFSETTNSKTAKSVLTYLPTLRPWPFAALAPSTMADTSARDEAVKSLISASAHLGTKNVDHQMHDYIWRRRQDGIHILDASKTWEKIQLAARVIVAIENPQDVIAISARPYAQRAVLKFATYTGAQSVAGRYTPGTFTNQITKQVRAQPPQVQDGPQWATGGGRPLGKAHFSLRA
jgi:hypothetical protein